MAEINRLRRPGGGLLEVPRAEFGEIDRAGTVIGHLLFGVVGLLVGFGLAHLPGVCRSVTDAALRVLGW